MTPETLVLVISLADARERRAGFTARAGETSLPWKFFDAHRQLAGEFEQACKSLDVMDDDQYLMDLQQIDLAKFGLAAVSADASLLRATDATTGDYYGGGFGGYGGPL